MGEGVKGGREEVRGGRGVSGREGERGERGSEGSTHVKTIEVGEMGTRRSFIGTSNLGTFSSAI